MLTHKSDDTPSPEPDRSPLRFRGNHQLADSLKDLLQLRAGVGGERFVAYCQASVFCSSSARLVASSLWEPASGALHRLNTTT